MEQFAKLTGANFNNVDLSNSNLTGLSGNKLSFCPRYFPEGWKCDEEKTLIEIES